MVYGVNTRIPNFTATVPIFDGRNATPAGFSKAADVDTVQGGIGLRGTAAK